ncbi:hypothetical protein SMACR_05808 [Sordaria macrospora]|nr:hypothetical protein SMACR_05808 [Sordaria macrospora]KAH7626638.1 hypothetical protein B0T09DRAFT_349527 [Sordaria sp. MPI-SDFR-AT-0083]WPJ57812.1 hypothetical protein SMAC4_05808 [Sordaria macrospora]
MASISPQLPPHLQKRKRDSKDEESASPPTKISRPDNQDEIPLDDDDSDDGFDPSAPQPNPTHSSSNIGPYLPPSRPSIGPSRPDEERVAKPTTQPSIGPSLPPPPPTTTNNDEIPLDDSDGDDIGPAAAAPSIGPTMPPPAPKRIYGPAPPPADLSERPTTDPNAASDSDSDSDDGYGPALPGSRPGATSSARGPFFPSFAQQQAAEESQAPKRDDWMIAPPTDSAYRAPDPTKLKSRKFASGRSAATEKSGGVSSIWTETPEEKIKRLAAAVLGREDPSASHATASASASSKTSSSSRSKNLDEARVRSYTEQTRGRSLVEEHQAAIAAGKKKLTSENSTTKPGRGGIKYGKQDGVDDEDDPSKRAFDREKDMAVGGRISHTQRKDLLNRAANFGDRFQSGKFL